jgi:hypothetical protein
MSERADPEIKLVPMPRTDGYVFDVPVTLRITVRAPSAEKAYAWMAAHDQWAVKITALSRVGVDHTAVLNTMDAVRIKEK